MKWWLIVNLSHLDDSRWGFDAVIHDAYRPKYLHLDRSAAEAELLRLREKTGDEFALFESVAYAPMVGGGIGEPRAFVVEPINA